MDELNLEVVLGLSDDDAFSLSTGILEAYFKTVYTDGELYAFTRGASPILLTAHVDTKRKGTPVELAELGEYIINRNGILGADDRAGIFMIFRALSECSVRGLPLPSVLITNKEEVGMKGAKKFCCSEVFFDSGGYDTTSLILGLDCSGARRYVTYGKNIPIGVENYLLDFGFAQSHSRRRSDITVLSRAYESIPCANISIGYENEHTKRERLHLQNYIDSFQRVIGMLKNPLPKKEPKREGIRIRKNSSRSSNRDTQNVCGNTSHAGC